MATISAYNLAIGVQQRRYPYEAAIKSGLTVADEFCIAYDKRFDNPEIFTTIDPRVKPIEIEIDFNEWDFVCKALTTARQACKGDWCLYLEMDEVLHEKDSEKIRVAVDDAHVNGREAVHMIYIDIVQNMVKLDRFIDMNIVNETTKTLSSRQKITKNESFIYHKIADYMIGRLDAPDGSWDSQYIQSYAYDDVPYYDERTNKWFNDTSAKFIEDGYMFPDNLSCNKLNAIDYLIRNYTYIYHYVVYNYGRKHEQARQTAIWQDRMYGRRKDLDVEALIRELQTTIVIDPIVTKQYIENLKNTDWVEIPNVFNRHPKLAIDWIKTMGVDTI